ncbi:MAG: DUF1259 domain-containing protein [Gemmatimonadales bacterium]
MTSLALCVLVITLQQPSPPSADWKDVDQILGRPGTLQGESYRIGFPRSDLRVSVGPMTIKPAFALGSWVAFRKTGDSTALLMGDLVLLESEIAPVIDALQRGGVEQTALHNHLMRELPHIVYLHVGGRGRPGALASAVREALARTGTPPPTSAAAAPTPFDLDTAQIAQILGAHGKVNGGVYQLSVPRATPVMMDSVEVPPAMGVATAINFQPTDGTNAAIAGDFVMIASEVNPVIRALRSSGIEIAALHSHMLNETPRLLFMHFWAVGDAVILARGLRAALDQMNVKRS